MRGKRARAIRQRHGVKHVRLASRNPHHNEQPIVGRSFSDRGIVIPNLADILKVTPGELFQSIQKKNQVG